MERTITMKMFIDDKCIDEYVIKLYFSEDQKIDDKVMSRIYKSFSLKFDELSK
jgi:hypothetical protein